MTIEKQDWLRAILQWRGSVVPAILPRVLLCMGLAVAVAFLYKLDVAVSWSTLGSLIPNVVFNLVLGLLLVFRTNTAYQRFWQGRQAWGDIVVNLRNLARQIRVAVVEQTPDDRQKKAAILRLLGAFAIATKLSLRQESIETELEPLLDASQLEKLQQVQSPPLEIALWVGEYLQQQQQRDCLSLVQLSAMNGLLDRAIEAFTNCEGIRHTPMPLAYAIHLKQLILIYCFSLPFQVINNLHWWTIPAVGLISFALLGIEEIGVEIENPFGRDPNDLPLDEICSLLMQNIDDLLPCSPSDRAPVEALETAQFDSITP